MGQERGPGGTALTDDASQGAATGGTALLIDGNSLAYRAFFALPPLVTAAGQPTNAIYGFLVMLFRLLEDERPDYVAVAFDRSEPTFRLEEYAGYKAHRKPMPDDLRSQIPLLKEVLATLGVAVFELEGYEADDIIGTMATRMAAGDCRVLIVSGDRDVLQLVSPSVTAILTRRGISEIKHYDRDTIREEYGIEPGQVVDVKGLMGDASDNIPGVPGVGEKTALRLVQGFGDIETLLANLEQLDRKKLAENLAAHAHQALMSKKLASINCQVPVGFNLADCRVTPAGMDEVRSLFRRLEFRTLLKRLSVLADMTGRDTGRDVGPVGEQEAVGQCIPADGKDLDVIGAAEPVSLRLVSAADRDALGAMLAGARAVALAAVEGVPAARAGEPGSHGVAVAAGAGNTFYLRPDRIHPLDTLRSYLEDPAIAKYGHDIKSLLVAFRRLGAVAKGIVFDPAIAAYLLDPARSSYRPEDLARAYLGWELTPPEEAGEGEQALALYCCRLADAVYRLKEPMTAELDAAGLLPLFKEVEMPLVDVLAAMEVEGVGVDPGQLDAMSAELETRIQELTAEIHRLAGTEFNINSTRQLADVLFHKLGLPVLKKTKTGPSTSAEVLEALAPQHDVVARILEYRQLVKLKGTYVDGLREQIDPRTGRIHSRFNQTITATGRISSADPNLQNIPVRMELGRRIRRVFVPTKPGHVLLSADYSQIELRVLAHLSGDDTLIESFRQDEDIHARTAAEMFGVPLEQVTSELRGRAKAVNFGIIYGISDYGLARDTGVGRKEAAAYIEGYFRRYPQVKRYLEGVVAEARRTGHVTTILKRRRYLPELHSPNRMVRQFAERMAMNSPIQGSAADIIKLAMVAVHREIERRRLMGRMILQVHDELVFEVPEEEVPVFREMVAERMENAVSLKVPLKVDVKTGPNWYEMK